MSGSPLRRVTVLTERLDAVAAERDLAVSRALAAGATWTQIAEALGTSPQAAHKKYRWVRHNDRTGEVWHERPLPLH